MADFVVSHDLTILHNLIDLFSMNVQQLEFDGTKILPLLPDGMTMAQLAREVGVSRQAIHDIVKGRRNPSADLAVKLVTVLKISLTDLVKNF